MFRILGLLVKDDCTASARKVLKDDLYLFCKDYIKDESNEYALKRVDDEEKKSQINPYKIEGSDISITVNAIVGKNGDGKSSIVELILRVINNFAFTHGFLHDQHTLGYNISVGAILYYEIDQNQYAIVCDQGDEEYTKGKNVQWYKNGKLINNPITPSTIDAFQRKLLLTEHHPNELFYTLAINYSLYSYNSTVIGRESIHNNWINGLFFKNDAYQTPIGITPFRDRGNIDVNKEEYLSQQRLMSLYILAGADDEKRKINDDKKAIGFAFNMESESKLVESTILEYFDYNHETEHKWNGAKTIENELNELMKHRSEEKENNTEKIRTPHCEKLFAFIDYCHDTIFSNNEFAKIVDGYISNSDYKRLERTDFHKIIESVNEAVRFYGLSEDGHKYKLESFIESRWTKLNYAQLYRLILISRVWTRLNSIKRFDTNYCDLNEALHKKSSAKYAAKLYVCYKIIEILQTYQPFKSKSYLDDSKFDLLEDCENESEYFKELYEDIDTILATDDYTTLKLRQSINFIKGDTEDYQAQPDVISDWECKFVSFESLLNQCPKDVRESNSAKQIIQFLPPPIFHGIIAIRSNDKEKFRMSELSSGELQRLYSVGSFLYHLRNIACEQKAEGKIQYKNILVIFEEIELYFHPEYQKDYLNYLLEQIGLLDLSGLSLNLLFVTHSPFILSDVLKQNVLCLEQGYVKNYDIHHTFGANVFDILKESFFLKNGAIGTVAQKFISNVINDLNDINQRKKCKDDLFDRIMMIDEPIARKLLMDKYYNIFPDADKEKRIKDLEKQIEELRKPK